MALSTNTYTITAEQRSVLSGYLDRGDRAGFYVELNRMTGSQAALDMAEITSSSGLQGGTAWAINEAYLNGKVNGYPPEGIPYFSERVARGTDALIQPNPNGDGTWIVPSDLRIYERSKRGQAQINHV